MRSRINTFSFLLTRLDRRYVNLLLVILSLVLFILGAGAPEAGGGLSG